VFAKEYTGSATTARLYAHTMSDEIHQQQRALRGVARTKLTFASDRNREKVAGPVQNRDVKEVYIADYDGDNQRRVTTNRQLNITPVWAPDARGIAYTSYRRGYPDIFIALIYQGIQETPTNGVGQNWLPVFSPDGTRICFTSNRDGNPELYVMNRDGSNVRRITNNPGDRHDPHVVSQRHANLVRIRPRRYAADLHHGCRRLEPSAHYPERVVGGQADVGPCPVQRDRIHSQDGTRVRYQGLRPCERYNQADHIRRRQQREPGVLTERPSSRVCVPRATAAGTRSTPWRATARTSNR
jgi:hypothetical protein